MKIFDRINRMEEERRVNHGLTDGTDEEIDNSFRISVIRVIRG